MRSLLIIIWLLLIPAIARSQSFSGGVIGGMTSNQIDGDGLGGFDHTGIQLGFFASRNFSDHWSGRLELQYIWRGSREPDSDTSSFYRTDLHQISLPLVATYSYRKLRFDAGVSADLNVIAREENLYGAFESEPPFHALNASGLIGVGYAFNSHFQFNIRYSYSLTPLRDVRIVRRSPGIFGDLITGQRASTVSFLLIYTWGE